MPDPIVPPGENPPPAPPSGNPPPGGPPVGNPPPTPPPSSTVLNNGGNPNPPPVPPPAPGDWRTEMAGGDERALKVFERFASPKDAGKAYLEAQAKIRSGEMAKPLAKDATPDQAKEWRAANNVPEAPEKYWDNTPKGLVIGEEDKPIFNDLGKFLHGKNVPADLAHGLAEWYYKFQEDSVAKTDAADKENARKVTDDLRQEWGADYRANINQATSLLDSLGPELKAQVMDATLPSGVRMFNDANVVKWFVSQAREINPAGPIAPGGAESQVQSGNDEIAGIEKLMGNSRSDYWKGPKSDQMQARYRTLLEAREKLQKRA